MPYTTKPITGHAKTVYEEAYGEQTPEEKEAAQAGGVLDPYSNVWDTYYGMPQNNRWLASPNQFPTQEQAEYGKEYTQPAQPQQPDWYGSQTGANPYWMMSQNNPWISQLMNQWGNSRRGLPEMDLSELLTGLFSPNNQSKLQKLLGF